MTILSPGPAADAPSSQPPPRQRQQQQLHAFLAHERLPPAKPPTHATNDVSDIPGARPALKEYAFVHKPQFDHTRDIAGSTSKELHPRHRRVGEDPRFQQLPIEGSSSLPAGFRTNRVCDPLNPAYKLPSFTPAEPVVPRFLRDSYDVSDIRGTRHIAKVITNPREPNRLDDIPRAQSGWLPFHKRGLRENPPARHLLDVADIINVDFRSSRVTDVLNPVYTVHGTTTEDDPLMRPKRLHPDLNKPRRALETADIAGANPYDASKNVVGRIPNDRRREFRLTNRTDDIGGAQADTVLHSIRSHRRVDPNWPEYVVLDGQHVDASAMSTAKSLVFADLIKAHESDERFLLQHRSNKPPHVVAGIANIGMTQEPIKGPLRRSSAPASVALNTAAANIVGKHGSANATTTRTSLTPAEKKQAETRREEIQMVRDLK